MDSPNDLPTLIARMAEAGVQTVRIPFRWHMIEPSRGQFAFNRHDQIVSALRARGIEVLGIPSDVPTWANGQSGPWSGTYPPINDADWGNFVYRIAEHFKTQVTHWELWNEENGVLFFRPRPDAARYVQLLRIGFTAARTGNPDARVVLGGLAGNGVYMGWEPPESRDFLQMIYDAGGGGFFDIVAIHPYVHPLTQGFDRLRRFVGDTRRVMAANGDGDKPIWLTELGWSTSPAWGWPPTPSETDVATWLETVYRRRAELDAERIFWFNLRDFGSDPLNVGENRFGLLRHDLTAKPAYFSYRTVAGGSATLLPGIPSNLMASSSGSSVTLTWAAPLTGPAPESYTIEAGSATGQANLGSIPTGTTATTFSTTGVPAGTYFVRVRSRNSSGTSGPSNEAIVAVGSGGCSAAPGAPGNLTLVSVSGGTVVLSWVAAAGSPVSYVVEAASRPGLRDLANIDLGNPTTSLTAQVGRGIYYVRLRGSNACGVGPASNEVIVTVS